MRRSLFPALLLGIIGVFSVTAGSVPVPDRDAVTPVAVQNGWLGETIVPIAAAPELNIVGAPSSEGAVRKLWEFCQQVNGGKHLPTWRQETGDCVSMGATCAIDVRQCVGIVLDLNDGRIPRTFKPAFPPWNYGVSRTDPEIGNGKLGNGAGSIGAWAVKAAQLRGVIPIDGISYQYSGKLADQWGRRPGPPKDLYPLAEQQKLQTFALVKDYESARDAIGTALAPVTVASNQGFDMKSIEIGGHLWGRPSGRWAHQMCFIAVDDTLPPPPWSRSKKPGALYCQNSWGAKAHWPTDAPDGAPPGGFWVDRDTADRMLSSGDSYAWSDFDGFKPRGLDFGAFEMDPATIVAAAFPGSESPPQLIAAPDQPVAMVAPSETIGIPRPLAQTGGAGFVLAGLVLTSVAAKMSAARRREAAAKVMSA